MGSSFRWIPNFYNFSWNPLISIKSQLNHKKCVFCGFSEEFHDLSQKGMRIPVNSLVYSKVYGLGCEGDHSWPRKSEIPSFLWNFMIFMKFMIFYGKVWNSRKNHPKATFRARGKKTAAIHMPFCMVRRPFGYFGSQNGGIHWISPILADYHLFLVKPCEV